MSQPCLISHFVDVETRAPFMPCFDVRNQKFYGKDAGLWHIVKQGEDRGTINFIPWIKGHIDWKSFEEFAIITWAIWKD